MTLGSFARRWISLRFVVFSNDGERIVLDFPLIGETDWRLLRLGNRGVVRSRTQQFPKRSRSSIQRKMQ